MEDHVFRAIEQKKVSAQIVDQVKTLIASGKLKPGDTLPPERELMKVFKVGNSSKYPCSPVVDILLYFSFL